MRSILQHVVFGISTAFLDLLHFAPDALHHFEEAIQLSLTFTFGGLDHERAMYREGKRRSMVAEVHEALSDIALIDAVGFLELATVEDQLVTDTTRCPRVDDTIGILETDSHVVGVEDCRASSTLKPLRTQQADVSVGDDINTGTTERSSRDDVPFDGLVVDAIAMRRLVRSESLSHTDRATTRTTTTVRDSEGLMQVEVTDVCTDEAWVGKTYLSIHVRTIHVDEGSAIMDALTEVDDVRLEDPVRTGVGDHHRSEVILMLLGLLHEVFPVYITMLIARYDDTLVATLRSRSRVRTVSRSGQKDLITVTTSVSFVVRADRTQTCIFPGSTRIRLERYDG